MMSSVKHGHGTAFNAAYNGTGHCLALPPLQQTIAGSCVAEISAGRMVIRRFFMASDGPGLCRMISFVQVSNL